MVFSILNDHRPSIVPVSPKAHVQDVPAHGLERPLPAVDPEHAAENAAAPIVRLIVQAKKDIKKLADEGDPLPIISILEEAKQLVLAAPFNPHKALHLLIRVLDRAESLRDINPSPPVLGLIGSLRTEIAEIEAEIEANKGVEETESA